MKEYLFDQFLREEFMKEYIGDKEHYERAFESWLEGIDGGALIAYANRAMEEQVV